MCDNNFRRNARLAYKIISLVSVMIVYQYTTCMIRDVKIEKQVFTKKKL